MFFSPRHLWNTLRFYMNTITNNNTDKAKLIVNGYFKKITFFSTILYVMRVKNILNNFKTWASSINSTTCTLERIIGLYLPTHAYRQLRLQYVILCEVIK